MYAHPIPLFSSHTHNPRPQYLNAIWEVINFEEAERRFVSKDSNL